MAIYRNISLSFWTDTKVMDEFTPEDKYFMLYCLTNNYTNLIGCYEISVKQIANDMGYSKDSIENLLKRFTDVHKVAEYDFDTKELFIRNWYKYNWNNSPKIEKPLIEAIRNVKSDKFREELIEIYNSRDTVSIPYPYGIKSPVTVTVTDTVSVTDYIKEIINYLNDKLGTRFKPSNKDTQKHIRARLNEGFTVDDFKTVIDKKVLDWKETDMESYLRPSTLFGNKFEGYLNQKIIPKKKSKEESEQPKLSQEDYEAEPF